MKTAPARTAFALAAAWGLSWILLFGASDGSAASKSKKFSVLTPTPSPSVTVTPTKTKKASRRVRKTVKSAQPAFTSTRTPEPPDGEEAEGKRPAPEMGLSVAEISRRVDEAQAAMKDVQMELKMEMKDALSGTKQKIRGVVKMKNPGRVFTHYTHPIEQFLYVKKNLVQMYQPDQGTVYRQKSQGGKAGEPVYLGVGHELNQYLAISRVSVVKEDGENVTLLFVPKRNDALFERMKVTINKRTWWPYKIEMAAPSVETKAEFGEFKFNQGMEDSLFEFTPPDDAQIVEGAVF